MYQISMLYTLNLQVLYQMYNKSEKKKMYTWKEKNVYMKGC